jgi:hypothetical protein
MVRSKNDLPILDENPLHYANLIISGKAIQATDG